MPKKYVAESGDGTYYLTPSEPGFVSVTNRWGGKLMDDIGADSTLNQRQIQAIRTQNLIQDTLVGIFLSEGWDRVDYRRLQDESGLSLGAIQRYYPTKNTFHEAFQGAVAEFAAKKLKFDTAEALETSWMKALKDKKFRRIVEYLFTAPSRSEEVKEKVWQRLQNIQQTTGCDMEKLLGKSYLTLLQR